MDRANGRWSCGLVQLGCDDNGGTPSASRIARPPGGGARKHLAGRPRWWEGYSIVSGVPSELSAIGAPTRQLWMWLGGVYGVLMVGFGWIVWRSAPPNRALRGVGSAADGPHRVWPILAAHAPARGAGRWGRHADRHASPRVGSDHRSLLHVHRRIWSSSARQAIPRLLHRDDGEFVRHAQTHSGSAHGSSVRRWVGWRSPSSRMDWRAAPSSIP